MPGTGSSACRALLMTLTDGMTAVLRIVSLFQRQDYEGRREERLEGRKEKKTGWHSQAAGKGVDELILTYCDDDGDDCRDYRRDIQTDG